MSQQPIERVGVAAHVHSLGAARELGALLYYPHQLTMLAAPRSGPDFTFTAHAAMLGPVTAGLLSYSTGIRIDTAPYETAFQCNVPLRGSLRTSIGDRRIQATRSRAAIYTPDVDTAISGWEQPCVMLAVKLDRRLVERRLAQELGTEEAAAFAPVLDVTAGAARSWIAFTRDLIARAQRMPDMDAGLAAFLAERCVDGFVAGVLGDADSGTPGAVRGSGTGAGTEGTTAANSLIVERALEAITYSSGPPLALGAIAEYAGVSGRSVQAAFRDVRGETPMHAQRTERLRRVYRELRDSGADERVSSVARRHGFAHLGRFSALYQREFGELPSETRAK